MSGSLRISSCLRSSIYFVVRNLDAHKRCRVGEILTRKQSKFSVVLEFARNWQRIMRVRRMLYVSVRRESRVKELPIGFAKPAVLSLLKPQIGWRLVRQQLGPLSLWP